MWWKFSIMTMSVFTLRFAEDRLLTEKTGTGMERIKG